MERKKKRRRLLVVMVMLVVIAVWLGGCGSGISLGLSSRLPSSSGSVTGTNNESSTGNVQSSKTDLAEGSSQIDYPRFPDKTTVENDDTKHSPDEESKPSSSEAPKPETTEPEVTNPESVTPETTEPETTTEPTTKPETSNPETNKPDKTHQDKVVALTFDDGPDRRYTPAILDILKEKGVKATFFVVGTQVKKEPEMLQRVIDEGHVIGNHSWSHKDLSKLSKGQVIKEVEAADKEIKAAVGFTPELFRAPYGALSDTLKSVMKSKSRELVGWNVDTRDWAGTSVNEMREIIRETTKPNGIILMHSFGGKNIKNTVELLPLIIDDLKEKGYSFVTADELT